MVSLAKEEGVVRRDFVDQFDQGQTSFILAHQLEILAKGGKSPGLEDRVEPTPDQRPLFVGKVNAELVIDKPGEILELYGTSCMCCLLVCKIWKGPKTFSPSWR